MKMEGTSLGNSEMDKFDRIQLGILKINGKIYPLFRGLNTIGRNQQAVVNIKDINVSQQHSIITIIDEKQHFISDTKSSNGTNLNNRSLLPLKLYKLLNNDEIQFGSITGKYLTAANNDAISVGEVNFEASQAVTDDFYENSTQVIVDDQQKVSSLENQGNETCFKIPDTFKIISEADEDIHSAATQIVPYEELDNIHDMTTQIIIYDSSFNDDNVIPVESFCTTNLDGHKSNENNEETVVDDSMAMNNVDNQENGSNDSIDFLSGEFDNKILENVQIAKEDSITSQDTVMIGTRKKSIRRLSSSESDDEVENVPVHNSATEEIDDEIIVSKKKRLRKLSSSQSSVGVEKMDMCSEVTLIEDLVEENDSDTDIEDNLIKNKVICNESDVVKIDSDSETDIEDDLLESNKKSEHETTELRNPNEDSNVKETKSRISEEMLNTSENLEENDQNACTSKQIITPEENLKENEDLLGNLDENVNEKSCIFEDNLNDTDVIPSTQDVYKKVQEYISSLPKESASKSQNSNESFRLGISQYIEKTQEDTNKENVIAEKSTGLDDDIYLQATQKVQSPLQDCTKENFHAVKQINVLLKDCKDSIHVQPTHKMNESINDIYLQATQKVNDDLPNEIDNDIYIQATQKISKCELGSSDLIFLQPTQKIATETQLEESDTFLQPTQQVDVRNETKEDDIYLQQTQKIPAVEECSKKFSFKKGKGDLPNTSFSKIFVSNTNAEDIFEKETEVIQLDDDLKDTEKVDSKVQDEDDVCLPPTQPLKAIEEENRKLLEEIGKTEEELVSIVPPQKLSSSIEFPDYHLASTQEIDEIAKSTNNQNILEADLNSSMGNKPQSQNSCSSEKGVKEIMSPKQSVSSSIEFPDYHLACTQPVDEISAESINNATRLQVMNENVKDKSENYSLSCNKQSELEEKKIVNPRTDTGLTGQNVGTHETILLKQLPNDTEVAETSVNNRKDEAPGETSVSINAISSALVDNQINTVATDTEPMDVNLNDKSKKLFSPTKNKQTKENTVTSRSSARLSKQNAVIFLKTLPKKKSDVEDTGTSASEDKKIRPTDNVSTSTSTIAEILQDGIEGKSRNKRSLAKNKSSDLEEDQAIKKLKKATNSRVSTRSSKVEKESISTTVSKALTSKQAEISTSIEHEKEETTSDEAISKLKHTSIKVERKKKVNVFELKDNCDEHGNISGKDLQIQVKQFKKDEAKTIRSVRKPSNPKDCIDDPVASTSSLQQENIIDDLIEENKKEKNKSSRINRRKLLDVTSCTIVQEVIPEDEPIASRISKRNISFKEENKQININVEKDLSLISVQNETMNDDSIYRSDINQSFALLEAKSRKTSKTKSSDIKTNIKINKPKNRRSMEVVQVKSEPITRTRRSKTINNNTKMGKNDNEDIKFAAPRTRRMSKLDPKLDKEEKVTKEESHTISVIPEEVTTKVEAVRKRRMTNNSTSSSSSVSDFASPTKKMKSMNLDETLSSPERSKRKQRHKVVFTMLNSPQLESMIKQLGGNVVDNVDSSTVLVTEHVKRSQKLLTAVGQGKPICGPQWIRDSKKANTFLDPWEYILKDKEAETKWDFQLIESLNRSKNNKLLENCVFLLHTNEAVDVLKGAIESCGGKCVNRMPHLKQTSDKVIIISSPQNKSKSTKIIKQHPDVKIILPEAIFDGVLRQELRFSNYLL